MKVIESVSRFSANKHWTPVQFVHNWDPMAQYAGITVEFFYYMICILQYIVYCKYIFNLLYSIYLAYVHWLTKGGKRWYWYKSAGKNPWGERRELQNSFLKIAAVILLQDLWLPILLWWLAADNIQPRQYQVQIEIQRMKGPESRDDTLGWWTRGKTNWNHAEETKPAASNNHTRALGQHWVGTYIY